MPDRTFTIDIVTPDRVVLSDVATSLSAPGVLGSFGVLPGHAPLLAELEAGELRYRRDSAEEIRLAVGGGFLQVFSNEVTVLADAAQRTTEIDVDQARADREAAREAVRAAQASYDESALREAEAALGWANARLFVAGER